MFANKLKTAVLSLAALVLLGAAAGPAAAQPAGKEPVKIEFEGWFSNPVFSPDSKTLAYGQMAAIPFGGKTSPVEFILWDVAKSKQIEKVAGPADDSLIGPFALAPDGKHVAVGMWNTAVRFWDLNPAKETGKPAKSGGATQLRYTPDGKMVGWIRQGEMYLADPAKAEELRHFGKEDGNDARTWTFVNRAKGEAAPEYLVIAGYSTSKVAAPGGKNPTMEHTVTYWAYDAANGKKLHQVGATATEMRQLLQGLPPINAFVSDGGKSVYLAPIQGNIQVCEPATGKKVKDLPVPWKGNDIIRQMAMATDAPILATVTGQGVVTVWDLAAGKQLHQFNTGFSLDHIALSPNGKTLAVDYQIGGKVGAVMLVYSL